MLKYEAQLREILSGGGYFTEPIDSVQPDTLFQSAGMDSLKFVQLIIQVEDAFDIEFPEDKMVITQAGTIQKLCDIIEVQKQENDA